MDKSHACVRESFILIISPMVFHYTRLHRPLVLNLPDENDFSSVTTVSFMSTVDLTFTLSQSSVVITAKARSALSSSGAVVKRAVPLLPFQCSAMPRAAFVTNFITLLFS